MKLSPISFKGIITIKTYQDNNTVKIDKIKTSKKQDGELLKAATDVLKYEYKEPLDTLYARNTKNFHRKLENIIGKKVKMNDKGSKSLYIGGESLYQHEQQYNTSYNKIFYRDENCFSLPKCSITIDLMEPRERQAVAIVSVDKIKKRIETIFDTKIYDHNFHKIFANAKLNNCAEAEEALEKVRYYLDGMLNGADTSHLAQNCETPAKAYTALVKGIMKTMDCNYEETGNVIGNYVDIPPKNFQALKRAVYYLDCVNNQSHNN